MPFLTSLKLRLKAASKAFLRPLPPPAPAPSVRHVPDLQLVEPGQLLQGKNVLITGAGRNIGRAIALECAQQGANIYFLEIDAPLCQQLKDVLAEMGVVGQGFVCDLNQIDQVDTALQALHDQKILIDVLVNNVGLSLPTSVAHFNHQTWQNLYQTNVISPTYLTHRVSQLMQQQQIAGNIIFISSIHQSVPIGWAGYSGSKAAIGMLMQELAIELAPHNIRVNGIAPGWIVVNPNGEPQLNPICPLYGLKIPPEYIGRAVVYLSSNYFSHYTTGTTLTIDAGLSLMCRTVPLPSGGPKSWN
jgi:NAD(P)-dependent dehydrogenase (short-subunit alcohol dehydrogenase family)